MRWRALVPELYITGHGKIKPGHLNDMEVDDLILKYPQTANFFEKIEDYVPVNLAERMAVRKKERAEFEFTTINKISDDSN